MFSKLAFAMFTNILFQKIIMLFTSLPVLRNEHYHQNRYKFIMFKKTSQGFLAWVFLLILGRFFLPASEHVIV